MHANPGMSQVQSINNQSLWLEKNEFEAYLVLDLCLIKEMDPY